MRDVFPKTAVLLLAVAILSPALSVSRQGGPGRAVFPRDLSIVRLKPDIAERMKANGKAFQFPFPNSVNNGRKFNPGGETVGQLNTAPTQKILVLFANFSTLPPGGPAARLPLAYFDDMLFGTFYDPPEYAPYPGHPTDRTLYNYYQEVSYGQVSVVTMNLPSLLGWTQTGEPYDHYCKADGVHDYGFGPYPNNVPGLVIDIVNAADGVIDFSPYAVAGEVPNLFVVFAGTGAEWSADPSLIWSHSWNLTYGAPGAGPLIVDGVKIDNYAVMPEVGGNLTAYYGNPTGPYPPTVGVYAHEYGHVLGLPDQYDYGYESNGTGIYSLMADGSWNQYPGAAIFSGNSPAHLDAWSKYRLGFLTPIEITDPTAVTLPAAETSPVVYKMAVPNSAGKEYFLLENRQPVGFDEYFKLRNVHGLAIYHIDDAVLSRNYGRCNEAENWKEFRSEGWKKAWTGERHYAVSIIQADDMWSLEHGTGIGYRGDLYPGPLNVTRFGNGTFPNSSNYYFWGGSEPKFGYSGVTVDNIQEAGAQVTAVLSFEPWVPGKK